MRLGYHPEPPLRGWFSWSSLEDYLEHVLDRIEDHIEQLISSRGRHF